MAKLEQLAVMVVAGNQSMRAHLRTMLDNFGMRDVQFAASAASAIRKLREARYDLILSEHDLGDDAQDGQHLLEDLRTHRIIPRSTVFIMISGERSYERVVGTAEFSPDDYVLKPFTPGILQARIERAMNRREAFLPVFALLEEGRSEEAMNACATERQRHPGWRSDFIRLQADLALENARRELAESLYREASDSTGAPWARLGHARLLMAAGRHSDALPILERLIGESEHYLEAYDLLAKCREHAGQTDQARATLAEAVRRSPPNRRSDKSCTWANARNSVTPQTISNWRACNSCSSISRMRLQPSRIWSAAWATFQRPKHVPRLARPCSFGKQGRKQLHAQLRRQPRQQALKRKTSPCASNRK
jgi:DNA-binding response OmpR family regulator